MLLNVDIVNLLLKNTGKGGGQMGQRMPHFIFVVWSALVVSEWVVAAWSRKVYLRPAEISSFVYLIKFKDRGCRVSCMYCFG